MPRIRVAQGQSLGFTLRSRWHQGRALLSVSHELPRRRCEGAHGVGHTASSSAAPTARRLAAPLTRKAWLHSSSNMVALNSNSKPPLPSAPQHTPPHHLDIPSQWEPRHAVSCRAQGARSARWDSGPPLILNTPSKHPSALSGPVFHLPNGSKGTPPHCSLGLSEAPRSRAWQRVKCHVVTSQRQKPS